MLQQHWHKEFFPFIIISYILLRNVLLCIWKMLVGIFPVWLWCIYDSLWSSPVAAANVQNSGIWGRWSGNSMGQSPSWEPDSFSPSQEILHILCKLKIYYHLHKSPLFVPLLSQISPIHPVPFYYWNLILILSSLLCQGLPSFPFLSVFSTSTLCAFLFCVYVTWPTNLIVHDFITRIVSDAGTNHEALHYAVCSSLLSRASSCLVPDHSSCLHKITGKIIVLCIWMWCEACCIHKLVL